MKTCPQCHENEAQHRQECPAFATRTIAVPDVPPPAPSLDADMVPDDGVGEYRIERLLGKGGYGTVYQAVHTVIGKQVAIKVLARHLAADSRIVSRFVHEARAVNQIRHRNIIDIFGFGQLPDGRHYYVMELLHGQSLDQYLRQRGPLSVTETVSILGVIARALEAAHAKQIAHRDLKPENVFLADDEGKRVPKLLDFGLAKLLGRDADSGQTDSGAPLGTPSYMSPEQCKGRAVDHRTDIYAFGITAYRMLTGAVPFTGSDFMDVVFRQISEPPRPPSAIRKDLPAGIDAAILSMLAKDPAERPQTIGAALAALEAVTGAADTPSLGDSHVAAETRPVPQARPTRSRYLLADTLLLGLVIALLVIPGRSAPEAPEPASNEPAPDPVTSALPASPPPAAPARPPAEEPLRVVVEIQGTEGAEVRDEQGTLLGNIPARLDLAQQATPRTLSISKAGYQPRTERIGVDASSTLHVELAPLPRPASRSARRPGEGGGSGEIPPYE